MSAPKMICSVLPTTSMILPTPIFSMEILTMKVSHLWRQLGMQWKLIVSCIRQGRLSRGSTLEKIGRGIIITLLWKIGGIGKG